MLGRDDILSKVRSRQPVAVDIPELGALYLQELSTAQLLEYNMLLLDYEGKRIPPTVLARIMAKLLIFAACDAQGNPLFTDADLDTLALLNVTALMEVRKQVVALSGIGKSPQEVSEDLKNSPAGSSSTN